MSLNRAWLSLRDKVIRPVLGGVANTYLPGSGNVFAKRASGPQFSQSMLPVPYEPKYPAALGPANMNSYFIDMIADQFPNSSAIQATRKLAHAAEAISNKPLQMLADYNYAKQRQKDTAVAQKQRLESEYVKPQPVVEYAPQRPPAPEVTIQPIGVPVQYNPSTSSARESRVQVTQSDDTGYKLDTMVKKDPRRRRQ